MTDILHTGMRYEELRHSLKARRESLGMTQGDLGRKMGGAAASFVSQLERASGCTPTMDTIFRWCRALHVELGFVVTPREDIQWDEVA